MNEVLSFQEAVIRLNQFWADHGCIIWQPHNVQVGAGTMNPATFLRVLGPEPWNVGYVEPSVRPADGRYGENPNRWQQYYQYQVILKPDPGNPQELCLDSLAALGIDLSKHDPRFVEDNWQAPGLGAWGLGWEVWLDGQEIAQFTYFQQAGGIELDPVSVEITYGLERIGMYMQGVSGFPEIRWLGDVTYGDVLLDSEIERCRYNFDVADVERLTQLYNLFEQEARHALEHGLVYTAHDYVLKCSHVFNILDARGAVGVTERARYFARMRDQARVVAQAYLKSREALGYPLLKRRSVAVAWEERAEMSEDDARHMPQAEGLETRAGTVGVADFVLEIGTEELPSDDLLSAIEQLEAWVPPALAEARLSHAGLRVVGTPRRLVVAIQGLALSQADEERVIKGPPAQAAFDQAGQPTRAAEGFARSQGVPVDALQIRDFDGRKYAVAVVVERGRPTREVLRELLPELIASLRFRQAMRWNTTQVAFSRPIRWLVALLGPEVIPFEYTGLRSGRTTRGLRSADLPELTIAKAEDYFKVMLSAGIVVDPRERRERVRHQVERLAAQVGGQMEDDPALLTEVANLVEAPNALLGRFDPAFLTLPRPVLTTVMKKHQRYFPVLSQRVNESTSQRGGEQLVHPELVDLLPCFITVANGGALDADIVRAGNEEVIRARFADARFFYQEDTKQPLADFVPRLSGLAFQEQLGSYLDKTERLKLLVPYLGRLLGLSSEEQAVAARTAELCKADLVTDMVIEFTSLQGVMGREYALKSGEDPQVAQAIFEHYLPRFAGDELPHSRPGIAVGLADRLDSIGGLFAVGLAPTGSADPYGLRRAALGIVQILIGREISLSLVNPLREVGNLLADHVGETWLGEVLAFIRRRLQGWLLEAGFRYDLIEAVLAERGDNPYLAYQTVKSFSLWADSEEFARLLPAYSRSVRIVRDFTRRFELDPSRFIEPATERLYQAYVATRERVDGTVGLDELFRAMLPLVDPINTFFDDVLVMTEDQALRENRLALLQRIAELPKGVVDLSKVMGF